MKRSKGGSSGEKNRQRMQGRSQPHLVVSRDINKIRLAKLQRGLNGPTLDEFGSLTYHPMQHHSGDLTTPDHIYPKEFDSTSILSSRGRSLFKPKFKPCKHQDVISGQHVALRHPKRRCRGEAVEPRHGECNKIWDADKLCDLIVLPVDYSLSNKEEENSVIECPDQHDLSIKRSIYCDELCSGSRNMGHGSTLVSRGAVMKLLPQQQHDSSPSIMDHEACAGNLVAQESNSRDRGKNVDVDELCNVSCDLNQLCIPDSKHGDLAAGEELQPLTLEQITGRIDHRFIDLLQPFSTWELKVVKILDMVRRRELTERNAKNIQVVTRFCGFNIAFFDLDKESEIKHGTPFHKIHPSRYGLLDGSINVISIKVGVSDVPINIYGTVLVRDQNDYRCVYLFKRGRDNPQLMTKQNQMLALTGPYRALCGNASMYFEFHLKIKGRGADDQDFCKGLLVGNAFRSTPGQPCTYSLESSLSTESHPSTVDMVCMPVWSALEASLEVNVLNQRSNFIGKICAWTSGNDRDQSSVDDINKIILYDSEVAGTETELGCRGSVSLTRHIVAVPRNEDLVLQFSVCENYKPEHIALVLRHDVEYRTCKLRSYELKVKVTWSGVIAQRHPKMWKLIGDALVLW